MSRIQRAAKPECQHPAGALAAATATASPDQHATAIRGCAGARAGAGAGAGGRASAWASAGAREEQVAGEPSGGLARELTKDRTSSGTARFLLPPGQPHSRGKQRRTWGRKGEGEEGRASGAQRRCEARAGATGEAGAGPAGTGGAGMEPEGPWPTAAAGAWRARLVWLIDLFSQRAGGRRCRVSPSNAERREAGAAGGAAQSPQESRAQARRGRTRARARTRACRPRRGDRRRCAPHSACPGG